MLSPPAPHNANGFLIFDLGITLIGIALGYAWPTIGLRLFRTIERTFISLARKKGLSVIVVGLSVILFRLAILPIHPIPRPFAPDDFSFLLAANTFASGRLANPTPAMWHSFETLHVTMNPTYMSMYFPGQGLLLAAGKALLGNPWFAVLIASALMCAAICWALQAWLPPSWALFGGLIAVLRLGVFSYWTNTYHAGGSLAALGGALILGALPRLTRTGRVRYALPMALGMAVLSLTRPFEGVLLSLPVVVVLARWMIAGKNRPRPAVLVRGAVLPLAIVIAAVAWLGFYDYRAFGNPLTPPYVVDRNTYAIAPYYIWQSQRPEPAYSNLEMRRFYEQNELPFYKEIHSPAGFVPKTLEKVMFTLLFFAGFTLFLPLIMIRRVFLDRRLRFLIVCLLVLMAGMAIEIYLLPHYVAPFTMVFYAIGLQAMRHLRVWKPERRPVGLALVRLAAVVMVVLAGARIFARPLHLAPTVMPTSNWNFTWYGPESYGSARAGVVSSLETLPGQQLAIVRYKPDHEVLDEWVYNDPDIDASKVVWARELDPADNKRLIDYYRNRTVWLIEPDTTPVAVSPYPIQLAGSAGAH
jgi:hypothetical protein